LAYIITPGLGLKLPDPGTIQVFETAVVNDDFLALENGIAVETARVSELLLFDSNRPRLGGAAYYKVATFDALAGITTAEPGDVAIVVAGYIGYFWNGLIWVPLPGAIYGNAVRSAAAYSIPVADANVSAAANFVVESAVGLTYVDGWVVPFTGIYEVTAFWRGGAAIDAYIGFGTGTTPDAAWAIAQNYGNRLSIMKKFTKDDKVKMFARASSITPWSTGVPNGGFSIKWIGLAP